MVDVTWRRLFEFEPLSRLLLLPRWTKLVYLSGDDLRPDRVHRIGASDDDDVAVRLRRYHRTFGQLAVLLDSGCDVPLPHSAAAFGIRRGLSDFVVAVKCGIEKCGKVIID